MNVIVGGSGTGKTRKLLQRAKENNAWVVCENPAALEKKAIAYEIIGVRFLSFFEFITHDFDGNPKIYIDDVGALCKYINDSVECLTVTTD